MTNPDPYEWIFSKLEEKLPYGQIKKAIYLANKERLAKEQVGGHINDPAIIPEAAQYAFRCLIRNSNSHELRATESALAAYGFNYLDLEAARNILPDTIWKTYAFPLPSKIQKGENVSIIAVYKNTPFVIPRSNDRTENVLISLGEKVRNGLTIITDLEAKKYPTLKKNYLGQAQIHFI